MSLSYLSFLHSRTRAHIIHVTRVIHQQKLSFASCASCASDAPEDVNVNSQSGCVLPDGSRPDAPFLRPDAPDVAHRTYPHICSPSVQAPTLIVPDSYGRLLPSCRRFLITTCSRPELCRNLLCLAISTNDTLFRSSSVPIPPSTYCFCPDTSHTPSDLGVISLPTITIFQSHFLSFASAGRFPVVAHNITFRLDSESASITFACPDITFYTLFDLYRISSAGSHEVLLFLLVPDDCDLYDLLFYYFLLLIHAHILLVVNSFSSSSSKPASSTSSRGSTHVPARAGSIKPANGSRSSLHCDSC